MTRASSSFASVVLLVSAGVIALPGPAAGDVSTCQGKPATVVGPTSGNSTTGTPGDDVIVATAEGSSGVGTIDAGDGNDVLCIVPGAGRIPHPNIDSTFFIKMGAGNDSVVVEETRNTSYLRVELGDGDDTFTGSSRTETVFGGSASVSYPNLGADSGKDHIDAGLGSDTIYSGDPSPDIANDDTVVSGPGGDSLYIGGKGAVLDNGGTAGDGTGDNLGIINQGWGQRRVTVDNATRTATADAGEFLRWSNVKFFHVFVDSPLTFTGSSAVDLLTVSTSLAPEHRYATTLDASMGAGDDTIRYGSGPMNGTIDGGSGADTVELPRCSTIEYLVNVQLDCLETATDGSRAPFRTQVSGFDGRQRVLAGYRAEVIGTSGPDDALVRAPRIRVDGRGGADRLEVSPFAKAKTSELVGGRGADVLIGGKRSDRLEGNGGNDHLVGRAGDDTLLGGRGKDLARGGTGKDACSAETMRRCERPRT